LDKFYPFYKEVRRISLMFDQFDQLDQQIFINPGDELIAFRLSLELLG
jgi:hypothetical protein